MTYRKLLIIVIFFLLTYSGAAQIEINGMAGFNVTTLKTNGVDWISESGFGYQAGVSATLGKYWYVEPGIFYSASYADLIDVGNNGGINHGITYQYHISSIRMPVLVGYHLIGNAEYSYYDVRVFLGPSVSFLLHADAVAGIRENEFNKVNWGLNTGIGFSVWFFYCNIGYEWGLNKIFKSQSAGNAKNDLFWMNIGYRFRL